MLLTPPPPPWDTFSFPQQKRPHVSKALLPLYKAMGLFYIFQKLKGTVSVNSSEPPWKYCNARFTTVPLTPYLINNVKDKFVILGLKVCNFAIIPVSFPAVEKSVL